MVPSAMHLVVLGVIYCILCADVSARRAAMPEDNPQWRFLLNSFQCYQACKWDIKMCIDGTWVYRAAELNCEFDQCAVMAPEDESYSR
ncbi:hypothetical protein JG688_00013856 [Phytophthora aleatoria]|uniref:Chitin-binding type-2 domain-containing protein n=1 Tax=Phytophthora aleatoria TaxID=2496075 RepID=A0A8J5II91_9STRA|nr:hypothetical protein JG688_00013856 [Phytophthora aleatoria]